MRSQKAKKVARVAAHLPATAAPAPAPTRTAAAHRSGRARTTADHVARWSARDAIVETIASSGRFVILGRALQDAGLAELLAGVGPFTVFGPTDNAFAAMPGAELHALLEDADALKRVLAFHIVPDRVRAPLVGRPTSAVTIDGRTLVLTYENGEYKVEGARIVKTNIRASNGLIHAINSVLLPR